MPHQCNVRFDLAIEVRLAVSPAPTASEPRLPRAGPR